MDWKFTFRILSCCCCFIRFDVDAVLVVVDVCTGLICLDGTGLVNEVSDKTLNWFDVLKTMEKQNGE